MRQANHSNIFLRQANQANKILNYFNLSHEANRFTKKLSFSKANLSRYGKFEDIAKTESVRENFNFLKVFLASYSSDEALKYFKLIQKMKRSARSFT